jgi:hypothetical protein
MANIGNDDLSTLNSYLGAIKSKLGTNACTRVTKERNNVIGFEIKKLIFF